MVGMEVATMVWSRAAMKRESCVGVLVCFVLEEWDGRDVAYIEG